MQRLPSPAQGLLAFAAMVMLLVGPSLGASAQSLSPIEARLATRILLFQKLPPSGDQRIAVLYDPNQPGAEAEAAETGRALRAAELAGTLRLSPVLVPIPRVADLDGVVGLVVTDSVLGALDTIAATARRLRVPTIARSLECVHRGKCVTAVQAFPKVRIALSRAAAEAAGVQFQEAVWVMVEALP